MNKETKVKRKEILSSKQMEEKLAHHTKVERLLIKNRKLEEEIQEHKKKYDWYLNLNRKYPKTVQILSNVDKDDQRIANLIQGLQ